MEGFIVSARKYRPNNFTGLIGQDSIAATLKNSILKGQLAHAYLFCGPRGVGKTTTARIFAKTINCLNPGEGMEPCGECESCLSFAQGRSYCIHELDAASNNSVDDIRLLTEKVRIPPQIGKYSVYIIDEVHMLSSQAFNAFLKTLEEPPPYAIFILATTEKHKILPTILSRCQTYDFNRISIEDIVKNLTDIAKQEGVTIDASSLHVIAAKADGAMRDALTLFDQTVAFCGTNVTYSEVIKNLNVLDYEYYFNIIDASLSGNFNKSFLLFDEILIKGFNALYFLNGLGSHLRNLLLSKDISTEKLLEVSPDIAQRYNEQGARCPISFLYEALGYTTKCEADYRFSNNQRLLVEFHLMRLSHLAQPKQKADGVQTTVQQTSAAAPVKTQESVPVQKAQEQPAQSQSAQSSIQPQSAESQPVVSQQTEQQSVSQQIESKQSKPKRPAGKSALSIKNILKKSQEEPAKVAQSMTVTDTEEITMDKLNAAWKLMGDSETEFPRLGAAIKQTEPTLDDDNETVVFNVGNSAQQVWIEKNSLPRLTSFLQVQLKNKNLKMVVRVKEVEEVEKKLYMPQEKAEFLLKNNPELNELRKELDLEIK